jgi:hypothetical protein
MPTYNDPTLFLCAIVCVKSCTFRDKDEADDFDASATDRSRSVSLSIGFVLRP